MAALISPSQVLANIAVDRPGTTVSSEKMAAAAMSLLAHADDWRLRQKVAKGIAMRL